MTDLPPRYLRTDDVAKILGCSPNHVRMQIRAGKLKGHKFGRRLLVDPADLKRMLDANATTEATQ